jgi:hypothetical protein
LLGGQDFAALDAGDVAGANVVDLMQVTVTSRASF